MSGLKSSTNRGKADKSLIIPDADHAVLDEAEEELYDKDVSCIT